MTIAQGGILIEQNKAIIKLLQLILVAVGTGLSGPDRQELIDVLKQEQRT